MKVRGSVRREGGELKKSARLDPQSAQTYADTPLRSMAKKGLLLSFAQSTDGFQKFS